MNAPVPPNPQSDPVEGFIAKWQGHEGGQERANYAMFLTELCTALGLPHPDVANASHEFNDYVFERSVRRNRDEGDSIGRIDLYKRNSFVLEAKQSRQKGGRKEVAGVAAQNDLFGDGETQTRGTHGARRAWDVLMLNAKRQAEEYAKALPVAHGWPPFILICDVGHCIEVYADFSGQGKNYTQFPDRQGFRIFLEDLRKPEIRERLTRIWQEPQSLDPTRVAAKVTREIAERLAAVSKSLEAKKYPAEEVAHFLMRCLFTMFAEDVKLLPENCFRELLGECREQPEKFVPLLTDLWKSMNEGAFAASIRTKVLRFNGNLFADAKVLPLGREDIGELAEAANKNWREVEPAIFGTLLEQALDPDERRRLGAHYTPRAYVERLVVATIIEPLREDWRNVQAAAETNRAAGDKDDAADAVKAFHDTLCATRVLDPACGTGNFLYVAMELMKRLEGEVLEALLDLGGQEALRGLGTHTVDPHTFLGLEINPRAAAIAELVLWIGYLQWHFRTKGGAPSEPILKRFRNIEVKNAVLTWDGYPAPQVVDGKEAYPNPKRPTWPPAEFIVGNPPFIGSQELRERLGDSQTEALWAAHPHINQSADFVMFWWDRAAETLVSKGTVLSRFGLVTTNSITQEFSRRVMKARIDGKAPISILQAIPDHPWTKATPDAAAVRIAMTIVAKGLNTGSLREVIHEGALDTDQPHIEFETRDGQIKANLTIGMDVDSLRPLSAMEGLAHKGVQLNGLGFILDDKVAAEWSAKSNTYRTRIKKFINGRDVVGLSRDVFVIDTNEATEEELRREVPLIYNHILATVKPERDVNRREVRRVKWWRYGEPAPRYREAAANLDRFIATSRTAKHKIFTFYSTQYLPESKVIAIACEDAFALGILSSKVHSAFAFATGGWLGVGNDHTYNHTECFNKFPFPSPGELLKAKIRGVAEELDAFRKERQREHPDLTLTQMYNVLEKLKAMEAQARSATPLPRGTAAPLPSPLEGEGAERAKASEAGEGSQSHRHPSPGSDLRSSPPSPSRGEGDTEHAGRGEAVTLTPAEEAIKDKGLILILKELHEKLDALVFEAYGWPATLTDEEILERLVALNHERAAEERRGHVRWLRPDYQIPRFGKALDKMAAKEEQFEAELGIAAVGAKKATFPSDAVGQTAAVFAALASAKDRITVDDIAAAYRKSKTLDQKIGSVLESLVRLGHVTTSDGKVFQIRRG